MTLKAAQRERVPFKNNHDNSGMQKARNDSSFISGALNCVENDLFGSNLSLFPTVRRKQKKNLNFEDLEDSAYSVSST